MTSAPLIIGPEVEAELQRVRELAATRPVDVLTLMAKLQTEDGIAAHRQQMGEQTVVISGSFEFLVTFSIENQPVGPCRHMSMSIRRDGRIPHPAALLMVAPLLGFAGDFHDWSVWAEELSDGGTAVNIVQPLAVTDAGGTRPN